MPITQSYLVCSTPRSGSNLLCEALKNTKLAGRPHQYFWADNERKWAEKYALSLEDYAGYVRGVAEGSVTRNGVFGLKSMWNFLLDFERRLRGTGEFADFKGTLHELLGAVFPGMRYIHITRRDTLRQAVSLARAMQTQLWTSKQQDAKEAAAEPAFDYDLIARSRAEVVASDESWECFFRASGVVPFRITYEELVADYEGSTVAMLNFLGIEIPRDAKFRPRALKKQGDDLNERWVRLFMEREAAAQS